MQATVSAIVGILFAAIVLTATRRREPEGEKPARRSTPLSWLTLVFGLVAVASFALAIWQTAQVVDSETRLYLASITFAFAAVVLGVGTLLRRERRWPTWAGLVAGAISALFWIAFAAGYLFGIGE